MPLAAGTRFGPYEIVALVGAGGMGEVYKARDTRLDRIVAIKILPQLSADDPQRRARFEREARAISRLTHPHICTLYDVGNQDGQAFLVFEYLSGETLASRLQRGALPLDETLTIAIEISDALDTAHRAGITHRDLKPGNVMLTRAGVKLLDFGLAKSQTPDLAGASLSTLSLKSPHLTLPGSIIGTFQYMAPEQLEGREADARTDLFAFGAVVYEMLAGRAAFEATSEASLIAAILERDPPPITTIQPLTPPAVDRVVKKCLVKDPDRRWQSARDLGDELRWIVEAHSQTGVAASGATRSGLRGRVAGIVAAFLAGAAVTGALVWSVRRSTPATAPSITTAVIPLPPPQTVPIYAVPLAISPDGARVVYRADNGSTDDLSGPLYVRALDQGTAAPIPGTEGAWNPFFSPNGEWVGFAVGTTLKKVPLSGGRPMTICETGGSFTGSLGAIWGPDDTIVFNAGSSSGLSRVSAAGGVPHAVTMPDRHRREKTHRWPEILPGGKAVIFMVASADIASYDDARIEVLVLETGERRVLIEGGMYPRYASTGHLVYARAGALYGVPFDVDRLEVSGTPTRILAGVSTTAWGGGDADFAFSLNGSLVYVPADANQWTRTLTWVDRQSKAQPITERRYPFDGILLSLDGRHLAATFTGANDEVWVGDLERDTFVRLAFGWNNSNSVWSPDGTRVAFSSDRAGVYNLFAQLADGSAPPERLTTSANVQIPSSWSPDGKVLAFTNFDPETGSDIWMLPLDGDRTARPFLHERFDETNARFSPDGRWLAYSSTETGRREIYVRPYPGPGGKWQISNDGGTSPRWVRSGRELFYVSGEKLMSVAVNLNGTFRTTRPRLVLQPFRVLDYDVAGDGQRFATVQGEPMPRATEINLVLNWFSALTRLVPRK
jgi:serine/threonine-protein kinase